MSKRKELPDIGIIPASTPAKGARWVMDNRAEAQRRVGKLRQEMHDFVGQFDESSASSTSIPSPAFSRNWGTIFDDKEESKS